MYYTIYKITNKINEKIYIGFHQTKDLDDGYMGSGKIIKRAIEKHGIDKFTKEYLAIFDNPEEMKDMESQIVNEDFLIREDTYNLKVGGDGGFDFVNKSLTIEERSNRGRKGAKSFKKRLKEDHQFFIEHSKRRREYMKIFYEDDREKNLHFADANNQREAVEKSKTPEARKKQKESHKRIKHQQCKNNSQYGTCWMYSTEEQKNVKAKPDEIEKYIELGYVKGRKMNF